LKSNYYYGNKNMAIYIISNDNYLQEGIVLLAKDAGMEIIIETIHHLPIEKLTFDDTVILHLHLNNKCCARDIPRLNKKCKLLIIQNAQKSALICDADLIINAREPLSAVIQAITSLVKMKKNKAVKNHLLNRVEKIIIRESLEGKDINLIAKSLSLPPKRVYTYRNIACKKLGGNKIHDLLLIKENIFEENALS
jgi:hypothetical protein